MSSSRKGSRKGKEPANENESVAGKGTKSRSRAPPAQWTEENTILFINIMHDHWKEGDVVGPTFKPQVWTQIAQRMNNESTKIDWTVKQLQEKLSRLKKAYKKNVTNTFGSTGWGTDPETRTLVPPPDEVRFCKLFCFPSLSIQNNTNNLSVT